MLNVSLGQFRSFCRCVLSMKSSFHFGFVISSNYESSCCYVSEATDNGADAGQGSKGLCFYCDENYRPRQMSKKLFMIAACLEGEDGDKSTWNKKMGLQILPLTTRATLKGKELFTLCDCE